MAAVITKRRWWRQPSGIVQLATANDLLAGVEVVVNGEAKYGNRVFEAPLTLVGNPAVAYDKYGVESTVGSTYNSTNYSTKDSFAGTGSWTIAGLFTIPFGGLGGNLVGTCETPNSTTFDRDLGWNNNNPNWEGHLYDGANKIANSGVAVVGDRVDVVVVTTNGATLWCYANDSVGSVAVSNAGYTGYSTPEFCIGNPNNNQAGFTFRSALVIRTRAMWNAEQVARFLARPWSVFAPQRQRRYFGVAAPAGSVARPLSLRVLGQARNRAGM